MRHENKRDGSDLRAMDGQSGEAEKQAGSSVVHALSDNVHTRPFWMTLHMEHAHSSILLLLGTVTLDTLFDLARISVVQLAREDVANLIGAQSKLSGAVDEGVHRHATSDCPQARPRSL